MNNSNIIIKDVTRFTVSGYISSFLNFINAAIVRRILDPFFMGIYVELTLIFEYAKYSHLGIINSLDRQIPYYNGRKEYEKTEEVKNVGASFALVSSLVCALGIIVFSVLLGDKLSDTLSLGLRVVAIMVVIQSISTFYVTLVRTHHLFGPLSIYLILIAIFDIIFRAMLGIKFGVIGILWGSVCSLILGMFYLYKKANIHFRLISRIPMKCLKSLLSIGFPLLLLGLAFMALRSVDRIMIISFLPKRELGYYSIAIMMYSFAFQFPNLIYVVLFPRFYEAFASARGDTAKIRGYIEKPTLAFAYLFPIIVGATVIALPIFVNYVLPAYKKGITPASILLFGVLFTSITNMSGYLLIALKKQNLYALIGGICVLVNIIMNLVFIKLFKMGINGVALGTGITYFIYSVFVIGCASGHYMKKLYDKAIFFLNLYLPILWIFMAFYFSRFMFKYSYEDVKSDIFTGVLQILLFIVLTLPLIFAANKRIDLFKRIRNVEFDFIRK